MLDDASDKGLEEALKLLPVSSAGSGLLVTSYLIRSEADFRGLLDARADGSAASVVVRVCDVLTEAKAVELFHACGFKLDPEDAGIRDDIATELKVQQPHLRAALARVSHCCRPGHGPSPCFRAAVCGVEQPQHDEGGRQAHVYRWTAAVSQRCF